MLATAGMRDTEHLHCFPLGSRHMILDLRFILLLQYILRFSLNFDGSITQTDHSDKVGTSAQIHRQENEAPTIIDTIATGYLRAGPSKSVTLPS
jgi:hypothetical protein